MRLIFVALLTTLAFGIIPAYGDDDDDDPSPIHPLFKVVHDRITCDGPGDNYEITFYEWNDLVGWVETSSSLGQCGDSDNSATAPGEQ